jgi:hypothetical protein
LVFGYRRFETVYRRQTANNISLATTQSSQSLKYTKDELLNLCGVGWYLAIDVSGQSVVAKQLTTQALQQPSRAKASDTPRLNY